jgi:putative FmdB family regulatory protein
MPLYEYRCRDCDTVFEARRSMSAADEPLSCPDGHTNAVRLLSVFAAVGRSAGTGSGPSPMAAGPGAPCGSACACHPG